MQYGNHDRKIILQKLCKTFMRHFPAKFSRKCITNQASTDEDGRPSMWTTDENLGSDRPSHGQIRTRDTDINFEVDEWTNFLPWTVHLMDGFGRIFIRLVLLQEYNCVKVKISRLPELQFYS